MTPRLTKVLRLDSVRLPAATFTDEGYLNDRPILTTTGIFEYTNPDGSKRRELRLPEEVFDKESLASYKGKPIIVTHDAGLMSKDNVHENQIGTILSEGIRDGDSVRADIIIHDTDEMRESGLKELSLGYNLDLDETPGTYKGEPYDAIQRNIRVNHLALVNEARAGERARLNIDGRDQNTLKGGRAIMSNKKRSTTRGDGLLSPDELKEAIAAYKANYGKGMDGKDEGGDNTKIGVSSTDADEPVTADTDNGKIADKVAAIRERNAATDADDADPDKAARQDDDISTLCDIIDTLLAKLDYASDAKNGDCSSNKDCKTKKDGKNCNGGDCANGDADDTGEGENPFSTDADEDPDGEGDVVTVADADDDPDSEGNPFDQDGDEGDDVATDCGNKDGDDTDQGGTGTLNTDSVDRIVRDRINIGIVGDRLNLDGLEGLPIMAAKKAVIKAVRPGIRLDGKNKAYVNAMFDLACQDAKAATRKDTAYQRRQMFNKDAATDSDGDSATAARKRMIDRRHNTKAKEEK